MALIHREYERGLYPESTLRVSSNLSEALARAVTLIPEKRGRLEAIDLILAITETEGRGKDILKTMAGKRWPEFLENLKERAQGMVAYGLAERTIEYSLSLAELFRTVKDLSRGKPIDTGTVVLAEVDGPQSLLVGTFKAIGVPEPIAQGIGEIARRVVDQEKGTVPLENLTFPYQTVEVLPEVAPRERLEFRPISRVTDLLEEAREGKFNDVLVRPKWTSEVLNSLESQTVTILVTDQIEEADSIVMGLASQLAKDEEGIFRYQKIIMVDPGLLEANPEEAINIALSSGRNGVLYLPDLNRFLQLTQLRTAIAAQQIKIITTLTERQWNKVYTESIFQRARPIFPEPPTILETTEIITAKKAELEKSVSTKGLSFRITSEAIETAAKLADRYYRQVTPPGGAKALLIRAATEIKIKKSKMLDLHDERVKTDTQIDPEDVLLALQKLTGIEVAPDDPEKYLQMEEKLGERVVGQDEAIETISEAVRRAKAGLKDPKRPIGSFIFMGPSGVGKTELARTLAWFLFGDEEEMIILDMSEYQERHQVSRMIGSPPGYVGYEEGGQLTESVRKKPYSVVVFDEIEKAHPQVRDNLLQIMEEGRLTDGHGRVVDFRNTVVIMTGNVGSEYFRVEGEVGREKVMEAVHEEMKETFRPEFLNRVDNILIFNSLKLEDILKIVDIQMRKVNRQLAEQDLSLKLTQAAKEFLANEGYTPEYGARPLRRAIQTRLESPLSKKILSQEITPGETIIADVKDGEIVFVKETDTVL